MDYEKLYYDLHEDLSRLEGEIKKLLIKTDAECFRMAHPEDTPKNQD